MYTKLYLKDPFHYNKNNVCLTCTVHVMYVILFQPLSSFGSGLGISGGSTSRETWHEVIFVTDSPFSARMSSIFFFLSENHFRLSAIKCLTLHPWQRTITTPCWYESFDMCVTLRVLHFLHVNMSWNLPVALETKGLDGRSLSSDFGSSQSFTQSTPNCTVFLPLALPTSSDFLSLFFSQQCITSWCKWWHSRGAGIDTVPNLNKYFLGYRKLSLLFTAVENPFNKRFVSVRPTNKVTWLFVNIMLILQTQSCKFWCNKCINTHPHNLWRNLKLEWELSNNSIGRDYRIIQLSKEINRMNVVMKLR